MQAPKAKEVSGPALPVEGGKRQGKGGAADGKKKAEAKPAVGVLRETEDQAGRVGQRISMNVPYFDMIFARLASGDPAFEQAFSRHVHFGYWEVLERAYEDREDSLAATERLCQRLLRLADLQDGQEILDVGCGFGGTLASLNEQFSGVGLTGLNIDARQLELAGKRVSARPGNRLEWVQADACEMPFAPRTFDRVLAIECIFHFSSRQTFFEHVRRVLRPGGNLTLTDFVQPAGLPPIATSEDPLCGNYSSIDLETYRELAEQVGLRLTHQRDISRHVRPTYHWIGELFSGPFPELEEELRRPLLAMDAGYLAYCELRFDRGA